LGVRQLVALVCRDRHGDACIVRGARIGRTQLELAREGRAHRQAGGERRIEAGRGGCNIDRVAGVGRAIEDHEGCPASVGRAIRIGIADGVEFEAATDSVLLLAKGPVDEWSPPNAPSMLSTQPKHPVEKLSSTPSPTSGTTTVAVWNG
jgi:hypothetical protein